MNKFKGFGSAKFITITLRIVASLLVAVVKILAAIVEPLAEILGIVVYEMLVPALRGLQKAQDSLVKTEDEDEIDVSGVVRGYGKMGSPAKWSDGDPRVENL